MGICGAKVAEPPSPTHNSGERRSPAQIHEELVVGRAGSLSSWSAVAKESSSVRARLIMNNRGRLEEYYTLENNKLGQGSYGSVVEGTSRETGSHYAIKSLSKVKAKGLMSRYRQEISIMKTIDHPNAIKIVETFEEQEHIHIVMELCAGGDLYQRLAEEAPYAEAQAAAIVQQMLRPVCYMHQQRICHRDIKPENFLLLTTDPVEQNKLKLIDFGFSCNMHPEKLMTTKLGTPRYSSPQVLAGSYNESCDCWSCGVITFILLGARPPFTGKSDADLAQSVRRGNYSFSGPEWQGVSNDAKDLIRMLLKYQPQDRYTAEQALAHRWIKAHNPKVTGEAPLRPSMLLDLRNFCAQNRLRQAALQIVVQQLAEEETEAFRKAFEVLDANGNGVLTISELAECLKDLDVDSWSQDMQEVAKEVNEGSNSDDTTIGYTDFLAATLDVKRHLQEGACLAAFRAFDRDGDGYISKDDLERMLIRHGEDCRESAKMISQLLQEVDLNGDGKIDFAEFKQMLVGED